MSDKNLGRRTYVTIKFNNVEITEDIGNYETGLTYTDEADGATDDLKISVADPDNVWIGDWLRKEVENRDRASAEIAQGIANAGEKSYTVNSKIGLSVRTGASTGTETVGTIPYGESVDVVSIEDGWAKINYNGGSYYVASGKLIEADEAGGTVSTAGSNSSGVAVGAKVTLNQGATTYNGGGLASFVYSTEFDVIEVKGDRVVIGIGGAVTAAVKASDLNIKEGGNSRDTAMDGEMDGSQTDAAKYTKIEAMVTVANYDGNGHDKVLDCGSFELDNVHASGPPQKVDMSATSLSYQSAIRKTKKTRSWNDIKLSEIQREIASAGGYASQYLSDYDPHYSYLLQDDIPDIAFLSKLATNAGLCMKATAGVIVMFDGEDFEKEDAVRTIKRGDGSYTSFDFDTKLSTTAYSACHVSYDDQNGNTYEATFTPETAYSEGEVLEVTEEVGSNEEAMTLAKKRLRAANKGETTASFTMTGDPDLVTGCNIEVCGWGDFDGKYSIDKAVHSINGKYTTKIDCSKVLEGY